MPTNTYTPIGSVTLATATSEVTFTVPTGYRDLVLIVNGQSSTGALVYVKFNGDTTNSNYSYVEMVGQSGSPSTASITASAPNAGAFYASPSISEVFIMDASATDKHKTYLARGNNASASRVSAAATRWANTAAITSLAVSLEGSATFSIGTTFGLYGIVA